MPFLARCKGWRRKSRGKSRFTTASPRGRASPPTSRRSGGFPSTSTISSGIIRNWTFSDRLASRDDDAARIAREDAPREPLLLELLVEMRRHDREGFAVPVPAPAKLLDRCDVFPGLGRDTRRELVLVGDQGHGTAEVEGDALIEARHAVEGRLPWKPQRVPDHGFHDPLRRVVFVENVRARERDLDGEQAAQAENREGRFLQRAPQQQERGETRRRQCQSGCENPDRILRVESRPRKERAHKRKRGGKESQGDAARDAGE